MKKYIVLAIIIILIVAGIFVARGRRPEVTGKEFIRLVDFTIIEKGDVILKEQFYGTLKGINQTEIYPDVPGKFIKYNVSEGEYVKKDQTIAEIDRSIPGMTYESAKIKAPINGIVYDLTFLKGQPVMPQAPVANISDPSRIMARIDVPKNILNKLKKCVNAEIIVNGDRYNGQVSRCSYLPNNKSGLGSVDIILSNSNRKLINGTASIELFTEEKDGVLRIPHEAYHRDEEGAYIYIIKNSQAVKTPVETGLMGNDYIEIINSIESGDSVITVGSSFVRDGQKIRIK
ncbi:MAG: efflux RND transporter periplasmic adaptor subunit [candidate division WOR-3 bacterium]|nr:efflux RND transporter periplasmic adaptor subunit [candidate division WOR-3 bacterium]